MKQILITGATGNIGTSVIKNLMDSHNANTIIAGVRDISKAKMQFKDYPKLDYLHFDFERPDTYEKALKNVDSVFLLRPPHISDIETYFRPLVSVLKENKIKELVFLSVQGAEKSKVIPHNKIEKLITEYGLDYVFLRPSYFMQNLSTTLLSDIKVKRKIILPSGSGKFNWIDIENIGEATAILINRFSEFKNQSIELTGYENEDFYHVVDLINSVIESPITYESVNPLKFYRIKRRDGMEKGMIIVMLILHFLPRIQKMPKISNFYEQLTGKTPTRLIEFISREKNQFA